jgi:hypothetical protein
MRESPKLSLLAQADTGLVRAACYLLDGLKHLVLWLLGLLAIAGYFGLVFEYGEGLADVSLHEWAFMLLALLLTWRHCRYARHFDYGFWRGLGRWLSAPGILLAVVLAVAGLSAFSEVSTGFSAEVALAKEGEVALLFFALLTLYLGAPTRPRAAVQIDPVIDTVRQEPSIVSTPDKELGL